MPTLALQPHPSTPCPFVAEMTARIDRDADGELRCVYETRGDLARLRIPPTTQPLRTNGLWRHTCYEIFAREPGADLYDEFNFSPSGAWAAYRFERYRSGMVELELGRPPQIACERRADRLIVSASAGAGDRPDSPLQIAVSSVIEDEDGRLYYWALRHAPGKPDFHHAAGFAALLAAAAQA